MIENEQFQRATYRNIRIHVLPTKRFKTSAISVNVGMPLDENDVTPTALTPFVLRRGTADYPKTIQFRERLDELYGAGFGFNITKRGDYQVVQFQMDTIQDQFVNAAATSPSLLKQSMEFIGGLLTKPLVEHGSFQQNYVDAEKVTLQKRIEAMINNKTSYAAERCIQEMCKNEVFRLYALGQIDKLEQVNATSLYEHYERWLQAAAIDIYVVGATTLEEVSELVAASFHVNSEQGVNYTRSKPVYKVEQVNRVVERMDVTQGKLNMGLRTSVTYADDTYAAALMYNGILGGYPHSKLFINVREVESLAYYASSRLDGHKGIMTIQSGIEVNNYERAVAIIQKQLDDLKQGDISDLEMTQTIAMIRNQLLEIKDGAFEMISFDFNRVLSGRERTVEHMISELEQVSKEDIKQLAAQVELDTIYFLRDMKGE